MPLQLGSSTHLTSHQVDEFERVFTSFTDSPYEDIALVADLPLMLKCLGYGPQRVDEAEAADLCALVDPTNTGTMSFETFVRVVGRFVSPPPMDDLIDEETDAKYESIMRGLEGGSGTRSRSGSVATRSRKGSSIHGDDFVGVVGRSRNASVIEGSDGRKRAQSQLPGGNNLISHREGADRTIEMWSLFRLFDKDNKGVITAGDLNVASASYCGSMLSENDCLFIVNTLRTGWGRDGLSIDDFSKAVLK